MVTTTNVDGEGEQHQQTTTLMAAVSDPWDADATPQDARDKILQEHKAAEA